MIEIKQEIIQEKKIMEMDDIKKMEKYRTLRAIQYIFLGMLLMNLFVLMQCLGIEFPNVFSEYLDVPRYEFYIISLLTFAFSLSLITVLVITKLEMRRIVERYIGKEREEID